MRPLRNIRKKRSVSLAETDAGLWLALLSSVVLGGCSTMYGPSAGVGGAAAEDSGGQNESQLLSQPMPDQKSPDAPPIPSIQGRAINGYLVNALVFQDANQDGLLSANENVALTDISGRFTLPGTSSGDLIVKPVNMLSDAEKEGAQERLRAIGVFNPDVLTTYYKTASGGRVDFKGQLELSSSMSGGVVNVTPLTTLVNGLVHSGQLDAATASQKVAQLFGMAPTVDYVALAASTSVAESKVGLALQGKAVALSNLFSSVFLFYEDSLSKSSLLESLAVNVLAKLEEASANPLAELDVSAYLASSADIQSILLEIGHQSDLEINLTRLRTIVDELVTLNRSWVDGDVVRLSQDTGISGVDHVTSDWRFSLPDSGSVQSYVYGVANRLVGSQESWLPETWYSTPDGLNLSQGINTIFIKPQANSSENIFRLALNLDTLRPQLQTVENISPVKIFASPYFEPDEKNYASRIEVEDAFFLNQEAVGSALIPQFQIIRSDSAGALAAADTISWLQFPNISDREAINGHDMRLYYRQMDLAGNFSDVAYFDFVYDNVAPVALLQEDASLLLDTGIYSYDKYTSSLALDPLQARYSSEYDESTVVTLGQWIRTGDAVDPLLYVVDPVKPIVDGDYTLVAYQTDRAGNNSDILRINHILDTTAPDSKIVSGFLEFNGRALPLLDYDRSHDSLTEWVQYQMVDVSLPISERPVTEWMNINSVDKSGAYDVYYRSVDRAGNASQERYAGQVNVDLDAPILKLAEIDTLKLSGSVISNWLRDNFSVAGDPTILPLIASDERFVGPGLVLKDYFVTARDASGNAASPWSMSSIQDDVRRAELRVVSDSGFLMQAKKDQATDFVLDTASDSLIALGSESSDRAVALNVGDIFLGLGGGDLTLIDTSVQITGLSFLNQAETQFFVDTFENFLTKEQLHELTLSPIFKAYLEDPDNPGAGGIAIFQSQLTRYGSVSSAEYFSTKWNPSLGRWFVDLGADDDVMYFGGDAMNVYGGAGSDLLQGGSGHDYLIAGSNSEGGSDILRGYAGNDTLVAGDYYFHSNVSAVLEGGSGNDTLVAGNGRSQLRGDAGADVFLIAPIKDSSAPTQVEIVDFLPGTDLLLFNGLNKDAVMKGIFVDHEAGDVVVDLTNMLGPEVAPYGSVLTLMDLATDGLLPEDIVENWFDFSAELAFDWSDLAIDTIVWS